MVKHVLLLGRTPIDLDNLRLHVDVNDVDLHAGTSLDDVRRAFDERRIDAVIIGAGIDLATRLEIVEHIFNASTSATVHMKDRDSGREGMPAFVNSILNGLYPGS